MTSNHSWRMRAAQILFGGAFVIAMVVVRVAERRTDRIAERLERDPNEREVVERVVEPVLEADEAARDPRIGSRWSAGQVVEVDLRGGERIELRRPPRPRQHGRGRDPEVAGQGADVGATGAAAAQLQLGIALRQQVGEIEKGRTTR